MNLINFHTQTMSIVGIRHGIFGPACVHFVSLKMLYRIWVLVWSSKNAKIDNFSRLCDNIFFLRSCAPAQKKLVWCKKVGKPALFKVFATKNIGSITRGAVPYAPPLRKILLIFNQCFLRIWNLKKYCKKAKSFQEKQRVQ